MSDKDFLCFLVDETFKLHKSGEFKLSSLELKLTDYNLNYLKGEFIPQMQILRFTTKFGHLDVPINWSVFSQESSDESYILSSDNDPDHIFRVMKKVLGCHDMTKLLVTHADGFCYLVGLLKTEEVRISDLLSKHALFQKVA